MKPATKLWIRKRTLMVLRAIVWRVDDWLHRQEVRLRDDIAASLPVPADVEPARVARPERAAVPCPFPFPGDKFLRHRISGRVSLGSQPQRTPEKKKRRGITAAEFDRRFAL